jgi:hypothetical protein
LLPKAEKNVTLLSGVGDPAAVHHRILGLLRSHFPETFGNISG